MNRPLPEDTDHDRDLPAAYVAGDPDAVREVAPREPSEAEWESAREHIHARLGSSFARGSRGRRWRIALAVGAATAAAVAWMAIHFSGPTNTQVPEVAYVKPAVATPLAPAPHEAIPDPLTGIAVLPIASDNDVVLHRVPGEGWLPVGADLLPGAISLATLDELELDDVNLAWPNVTVSPGDAPMIFAAKPR